MPTPTFQPPQGQQSTAQLQDWIIKLVRDLNYLLGNLDTVNINRLDANVIIANTITAGKMNVTQLSAIAADLGTITAGIIYGAYIATANGTYPRIELNSVGNLLTAFLDAANHLDIIPNLLGAPALRFTVGSTPRGFLSAGGSLALSASGINVDVQSTLALNLSAGGSLSAQSSAGLIPDIVSAINSKAPKGLVGTNIFYVSDTSGGAVTRKLTFTDGILTSKT